MASLSIVIPLAPEERALQVLVESLDRAFAALAGGDKPCGVTGNGGELLFVTTAGGAPLLLPALLSGRAVRIVTAKPGRAEHLNAGAEAATGDYLWFLHADSILHGTTLPLLFSAISKHPDSLLFSDLAFSDGATCLIRLNALGARFRSRRLKVPFGDQGFCIKKTLFKELGGFPLSAPYGEDHLFVWKARRHGVEVRATGGVLYSSARKYRRHGWLRTTVRHQYMWIRQALPEWRKLRRGRVQ